MSQEIEDLVTFQRNNSDISQNSVGMYDKEEGYVIVHKSGNRKVVILPPHLQLLTKSLEFCIPVPLSST